MSPSRRKDKYQQIDRQEDLETTQEKSKAVIEKLILMKLGKAAEII